jgi:malate dehydrogenase
MTKVSIIGAGNVGATVAQYLASKNICDIVMLDINEGAAKGKALDLTQAVALTGGSAKISGTSNYKDTANSQVIVITAGSPRKPGMSRDDLLKINASIVAGAARESHRYSPNAIFVVVSNPLDIMAYLVWKETGVSTSRVIGMAGVLDSARFQSFIAEELKISAEDVRAMVLGGHGDLMVPLPRFSTVNGVPVTELIGPKRIAEMCKRTANGGAEIVEHLKTGSAWYAPGAATAAMVEAIITGGRKLFPCSVHTGEKYGLPAVFTGLPVIIGKRGVERVIKLKLNKAEVDALKASAASIEANVKRLNELQAEAAKAATVAVSAPVTATPTAAPAAEVSTKAADTTAKS